MNWYKIAQEFTEWENHPDAHHDYDPSWDYEIDEVPGVVGFTSGIKAIRSSHRSHIYGDRAGSDDEVGAVI